MITISNYDQQKNSIDWKSMPKNIQDNRNDVESIMEFYNDDADIKETVDLFFKGINANNKPVESNVEATKKAVSKNIENYPKNLAQFKNFLKENKGKTLYFLGNFPDRKINETRVIKIVQSESVGFNTPKNTTSWIDYGMSSDWEFSEKSAKNTSMKNSTLEYFYNKPNNWNETQPIETKVIKKDSTSFNLTKKPVDKVAPKSVEKKASTTKEKIKEVVSKKYVDNFSEEFKLIKRFWNIIEDEETTLEFRKAQLLYSAFNKAAIERKVRKQSTVADIFTECNDKMKTLFEDFILPTQKNVRVRFEDKKMYQEIKDYVYNVSINPAVTVLKRFISLQNTIPDTKKVETLLKALEKVKINFKENRLLPEIESAIKALKLHLEKPKEPIKVIKYALSKPVIKKKKTKKPLTQKFVKKNTPKAVVKKNIPKAVVKKSNTKIRVKPTLPAQKKERVGKVATKTKRQPVKVATISKLPIAPAPKKTSKIQKIALAGNDHESEFYKVSGEVGKFLQAVERKPVESVVITMDGQQGAGKTTTLYKFMDAFAGPGNKCLFLSLEEHPSSSLAKDKVSKYLSSTAQENIDSVGEVENIAELYEFVQDYEIIFIDSWQKLQRMVGAIRLDEDLRKKFHGKVFVVIFQQTTTGRTKGGAEVVFDGDIIIKMVKEPSFADNYAYFDKNRYTKVAIEDIRYNIATGKTYNPNAKELPPKPYEHKPEVEFSFIVN